MLIVLKEQEDRADENINLKEFFGYNGNVHYFTDKNNCSRTCVDLGANNFAPVNDILNATGLYMYNWKQSSLLQVQVMSLWQSNC